jgi:hypothetical protein
MKYFYYHILAFAMICIFTACEDDSNSQLITSVTQLYFTSDGGSQTIEIESNTDWHIISDSTWISVYPSAGSGNKRITVTSALQDNLLEETAKIIISTNDGRKVINLIVYVEGYGLKNGKYLDFEENTKVFNGKVGAMDSLNIISNTDWELLGPEWLEAWDGNRWRPLSQTRGIIRGRGIKSVMVRTAMDNKEEENWDDVITVREYLTGEFSNTVSVRQLGRMAIESRFLWRIENGAVFEWRCGCDVAKIYYKVTDQMNESTTTDIIRNTFEVTDESYINSATDLMSGTQYRLIAVGEDSQGVMNNIVHTNRWSTPPKSDLEAEIAKGEYVEGGQWRFYMAAGSNTNYHFYATDNPNSIFRYCDPILWYIAITNWEDGIWPSDFSYYGSGWMSWENLSGRTDEIHAMAMAFDDDGEMRLKVFRYDRYYDAEGKLLPEKPLLDRIPKAMIYDKNLW